MPSLRDIRRRIRSNQNMQKITKAMQVVAATRMRRAQQAVQATRPYSEKMLEVLQTTAERATEYRHPYLEQRTGERALFIVVTADRGLCGALNTAGSSTEARAAKTELESRAAVGPSMEAIVERVNLKKALARVKRNKGASGLDGMTIDELVPYLKEHWPRIRAQLLDGSYKPQPVRRVEIPKASGGKRPLGIPTVLDRFIQQAVMQVLQADWDRTFSAHSYGFRPQRSAHQAVARAQELIASGHDVVVDIDLEKFFDRVNHDILMGLVAKRVTDKRVLKLIRGFLTTGGLADGLVGPRPQREEGVPLSAGGVGSVKWR